MISIDDSARAENKAYLLDMIAELAALASGSGERALAIILTAIVSAYR